MLEFVFIVIFARNMAGGEFTVIREEYSFNTMETCEKYHSGFIKHLTYKGYKIVDSVSCSPNI